MDERNSLVKLMDRLKSIGINVTIAANYPWVYVTKINGKTVTDKHRSEHGFTVAYYTNSGVSLISIKNFFKLIRKYINK